MKEENRRREYTSDELQQLHQHLYRITAEVVRVCDKLRIRYFVIGGTAIGVHFWEGIIPWDDDIDIGMLRTDYERFLAEAPAKLGADFFLQYYKTEPHTPFWFAKVRERNTLFLEDWFKTLDIHHGIYVDIFPFDKVPSQKILWKTQRGMLGFLNTCFIGKELWQWKYCGKCAVPTPNRRGFLPCLLTRVVVSVLPKRAIYGLMKATQTMFNMMGFRYVKNVVTVNDYVLISDVETPALRKFGNISVFAPQHLEDYLHNHYPVLEKYLPKEQQVNHCPAQLSFG